MVTPVHQLPAPDNVRIHAGEPLTAINAIERDSLGRKGFAGAAVSALRGVGTSAGLVVSVEGAWGSGKTSALALIEAYLNQEPEESRPVVVHFNPWLVGDRDALLKLFLQKLATAVGLTSNTAVAIKAAEQLRAYSRVFGVLKFVPGAEPWASITEKVISASGRLTESVAKLKAPDLEGQRDKVADALKELTRPIIVFIDDVDRLFAQEVFEVVRIVKAVGELPNVGYVIAWDADYVTRALESLHVPFAATYPDKIVQVRLPLPAISRAGREHLLTEQLDSLGEEVTRHRFPNEEDRLSLLYWSGLNDLLAYPRDFTRVFNTLRTIEPILRGEVAFADLLGLAALKVKAPSIYGLLHRHPEFFAGSLNNREKSENGEKSPGAVARAEALKACGAPLAVGNLVHHLFPFTASKDGAFTIGRVESTEGHLAATDRLAVALQIGTTDSDVSLVAAQAYLFEPSRREELLKSITTLNCNEFLRMLGQVLESTTVPVEDPKLLCLHVARLVDHPVFIERKRSRRDDFLLRGAEDIAVLLASSVANRHVEGSESLVAASLASDAGSLTVAARLLWESYVARKDDPPPAFACAADSRTEIVAVYAANVLGAAKAGKLLTIANPGSVLWRLEELAPEACPAVFSAIREIDPTLDSFALEILRKSFHTPGGQAYGLSKGFVEPYCNIEELRAHAAQRIADGVALPALAAWKSLVDGKTYFGKSGLVVQE